MKKLFLLIGLVVCLTPLFASTEDDRLLELLKSDYQDYKMAVYQLARENTLACTIENYKFKLNKKSKYKKINKKGLKAMGKGPHMYFYHSDDFHYVLPQSVDPDSKLITGTPFYYKFVGKEYSKWLAISRIKISKDKYYGSVSLIENANEPFVEVDFNIQNKKLIFSYVDQEKENDIYKGIATFNCVPEKTEMVTKKSQLPECKYDGLKKVITMTACYGSKTNSYGDTYVGEWKNGKYHGQGTMTYQYDKGEAKYVGEWKNGKQNGKGIYVFSDGRQYFGEHKDDNFHGYGVEQSRIWGTYKGQYENGNGNGYGVFYHGDGKDLGQWEDNKLNGYGILYTDDGIIFEQGKFVDDKLIELTSVPQYVIDEANKTAKKADEIRFALTGETRGSIEDSTKVESMQTTSKKRYPNDMFGEYANKLKISAQQVQFRFIKRKRSMGKYPGKVLKAMAYFEVLSDELSKDPGFDKKLKNNVEQGKSSFRKSFNFDEDLTTEEAIWRFWTLGNILDQGKIVETNVDEALLERKILLNLLKRRLKILRKQIIFDTSSSTLQAGEKPIIELNEYKGDLNEQLNKLIKDFKESRSQLTKSNKTETQNIDSAIDEYLKTLYTLKQQLATYKKSNDSSSLKAAAYSIDFINTLITETTSTIPSRNKIDMKSINFDQLNKEDAKIMQAILADINMGKFETQKNALFYMKELENIDYSINELMKEIESKDLGFEDLNETIAGLDIDIINVEDLASIDQTFETIENLNVEQITETVSESVAETTQAIEQVTEEVAQSMWEILTVNDVIQTINQELNTSMATHNFAFYVGMVDTYYYYGFGGTPPNEYEGLESWADAVGNYNQENNTNLSPEEAVLLSAEVICHYDYGMSFFNSNCNQ